MKNATSASSAKRSKKNSDDEERSKKKKTTKSNKRRRLRDSSLSSSSDEIHRDRRKLSKKPEKKRREPKNADKIKKSKKKRSRKPRHRSVSSSSSYWSRSCSTCSGRSSSSGSSLSRSPLPKTKRRLRSRSRGRGRDGDSERDRNRRRGTSSRSRYRSRSCSTRGRSRSRSPSSRSAHHQSQSFGEEYNVIEQPRRLRSVLAVPEEVEVGIDGKDEQRDKIIQAYDDFNRYDDGSRLDTYGESPKRNVKDAANARAEDAALAKEGEVVLNKNDKQAIEKSDVGVEDLTRLKSGDSGGSEAVDLESQLRQRALENLKKFQRSLSENARSSGYQEDESSQTQCHKDSGGVADAQDALTSLDVKFTGSPVCEESVQRNIWPEPRIRSVVNIPAERDTSSNVIGHQSSSESSRKVSKPGPDNSIRGRSNLNQLKRIEESSKDMSLQHISLLKDKQEVRTTSEPGSSAACDAEVNQADGQPTSASPADHKMDSGNGNKEEDTGSQFQQKTFSRMHDGEVVQVSYKVYIPKKNPALTRRQLQR